MGGGGVEGVVPGESRLMEATAAVPSVRAPYCHQPSDSAGRKAQLTGSAVAAPPPPLLHSPLLSSSPPLPPHLTSLPFTPTAASDYTWRAANQSRPSGEEKWRNAPERRSLSCLEFRRRGATTATTRPINTGPPSQHTHTHMQTHTQPSPERWSPLVKYSPYGSADPPPAPPPGRCDPLIPVLV